MRFAHKHMLIRHNRVHEKKPNQENKKKKKEVSILEKLTGYDYDQERKIKCYMEGCTKRFKRQYDFERHLMAEHIEEYHRYIKNKQEKENADEIEEEDDDDNDEENIDDDNNDIIDCLSLNQEGMNIDLVEDEESLKMIEEDLMLNGNEEEEEGEEEEEVSEEEEEIKENEKNEIDNENYDSNINNIVNKEGKIIEKEKENDESQTTINTINSITTTSTSTISNTNTTSNTSFVSNSSNQNQNQNTHHTHTHSHSHHRHHQKVRDALDEVIEESLRLEEYKPSFDLKRKFDYISDEKRYSSPKKNKNKTKEVVVENIPIINEEQYEAYLSYGRK